MEDNDKYRIQQALKALEQKMNEPENWWIFDEMRRIVNNCDLIDLRCALNLKGVHSIDYSFVDDINIRKQLELDNLRMENYVFNLKLSDYDRFFYFCLSAFFQVEGLINYYLYKRFGNTQDLLDYCERRSDYKRNNNNSTVEDIPIAYKLYAICHELLNKDESIWFKSLRQIRNLSLHRAVSQLKREEDAIGEKKENEDYIKKFVDYNNFASVRVHLKRFVTTIQNHISNNFGRKMGIVVNIVPAMIFLRIEGVAYITDYNVPEMSKVLQSGDNILVYEFEDTTGKGNRKTCKIYKYEKI